MIRITYLSLVILFGINIAAFSQIPITLNGAIEGIIVHNEEPLPGVNIILQEIRKGASAGADGRFKIKNIPEGTYTLRASYVGFKSVTRQVQVISGEAAKVQINMEQSPGELGELVVTGTMRETYVKNSPVKVEVVKVEQLSPGKTSANLMDLVANINGLSTQLNCGVCGTNAIRINGVEGPNTAVLIDGMPIMGALASVYGLNGISPSIIEQVEVIKGPQSTLYGTQALGGVVNIITKNPITTPAFSADIYGKSTTREGSLNLAASPKVGLFKGFVSGNFLRSEHYLDANNDGFNDQPKQTRVALFGKGVLQGDDGEQRFNIAAKYLNENRTGGVRGFSDELRGSSETYGESIYTRRAELLTEYRPAGLQERLRINTALTYHSQDSYYGSQWYDASQRIGFGQATWDQPVTDNMRLLTGATVRYETYNDNTPATAEGSEVRVIPGLFTQGEFVWGDVTLLGGLRVDHHTQHGFVTAPRLSAKYSPSDLTTIRASSGTGFRVVNVFTEDHAALTGSRQVVFKEDLAPEQSRSITASIEQIIPFGTNPMTLSADVFYTRFSNKIIPDYDQDSNLIIYENLDGYSVTQGFSVAVDQNFTAFPLSYNTNFTLMDIFTNQKGRREALIYAPAFLVNFGATYQILPWHASISYALNIVGKKRMPESYAQNFGRDRWSPTYSTHDIKITKEFTNVNDARGIGIETYFTAENIFNFTQGSPLVETASPFSPEFDTIYTWGPIVGRTFALGVRLNLR